MLTQRNSARTDARTAFFVAPFFAATTTRFIRAAAGLPGVRLGLISRDAAARLPRDLAPLIAGHVRVPEDALDAQQKEKLLATIPSGRLGGIADVAAATAFLASEEAGYITGQTLHVNGGMHMA